MTFETSKEKGRAGLSAAIAYFGMNGYTVSIPLNDTQDYDLIVDKDGVLQKVQCKSTGTRAPTGYYTVKLDSWGGANGGTCYGCLIDGSADLLFVLTATGEKYLIPVSIITAKHSLTLKGFEQYRVDF